MRTKRKRGAQFADAEQSIRRKRAGINQFRPNRSVVVVRKNGVHVLKKSEVSADSVGWKAYGLTCLPAEWVPPFFVVQCDLDWERSRATLEAQISDCLGQLKINNLPLIVRSSGVMETIEQRGRLVSKTCSVTDIAETIINLMRALADHKISDVHWVVQQYVEPVRKGHLSNERRVYREPRDFLAEFELQAEMPGSTVTIAVRHWRDGDEVTDPDLGCTSEAGVTVKLRRVALWASALPARMLFEWTWSGSRIWIVQADAAREIQGVNPNKLRPRQIPTVSAANLRVFRVAKPRDFNTYRKLGNAKIYSALGYRMPTFYVLDDSAVIRGILDGNISDALERDLQELTRRPLIIRTDGIDIPQEKRQMLPRSEDLPTAAEAKSWLTKNFSDDVKKIGIAACPLSLIVHHFIPSTAAAWARSEPGKSTVRIESLWGLPEGLYWHSHDTFEVDAEGLRPTRKKLRFKGTFVAPREGGRWAHYRPARPFDWGPSITKTEWLSEIAKTTRGIAERENKSVTVMWFVDNDPRSTPHEVLPWYHTESEIDKPKAAPRHKLTTSTDFTIETSKQWEELKSLPGNSHRVVRVRLEPKDPELVRNQKFAEELAQFAAKHNLVIELAGGILSHAYHLLRRHGAHVECFDLFGAEEENIEYNKLVRDRIPELIKQKGEGVRVVRLKGEALLAALRQKLVEESYEALDAEPTELIGELADIQEVVEAIRQFLEVSSSDLQAEREDKRKRRGGFRRGLMLRQTSTPHTLAKKASQESSPPLPVTGLPEVRIIEQANLLPSNRPYRRSDRRTIDHNTEGLLSFETELSKLGAASQSAIFEIPTLQGETHSFRVSIELERDHSLLWGQLRLRPEPSQMALDLTSSQLELFPKNHDRKE